MLLIPSNGGTSVTTHTQPYCAWLSIISLSQVRTQEFSNINDLVTIESVTSIDIE